MNGTIKADFGKEIVEAAGFDFNESVLPSRLTRHQRVKAALFSDVELSGSIAIAESHFVEADIAVFVPGDALANPAAVLRVRFEREHASLRPNQAGSQQSEIAFVAAYIDERRAWVQKLFKGEVLRFLVTAEGAHQH